MTNQIFADGLTTLYNGDARNMAELPDESVQMVCTSPPYWGLRSYKGCPDLIFGGKADCGHEWGNHQVVADGVKHRWSHNPDSKRDMTLTADGPTTCSLCGAWRGQFGLEPTVDLYVQHTVEILREVRRVLRKDGVAFWNLGDSYSGSGKGIGSDHGKAVFTDADIVKLPNSPGLKPKDLCLIPFRVALAAQDAGWWVRSVIIWSKNNPMPESVRDRPTESHEYILMLTKSAN